MDIQRTNFKISDKFELNPTNINEVTEEKKIRKNSKF